MIDNDDGTIIAISTATPRDSIGSGAVSFSSGSLSNSCSSSSVSTKTAFNECSSAWVNYLNVLNSLCTAGTKLAQSIVVLEQCCQNTEKSTFRSLSSDKSLPQNTPSNYLVNSWNDLARATTVATSTVKSHIIGILQDFKVMPTLDPSQLTDSEQQRIKDHNQLVIIENAQTMINIQHQFCAASYDAFSTLTCCFVCQAPVGFPHEPDCSMIKQKSQFEQRSQTPSPHFGASQRNDTSRVGFSTERSVVFGSSSSHISNEPIYTGLEQSSAQSPQSSFQDASPLQGILENIRGPLPNPGRLLAMKVPFYRNAKSPLNFPLFPLNGQRRWSEAAAGEVCNENLTDVESQMRRWSMPWEASKTDQNTVTWYQTRMMPMNTVKLPNQKLFSSERSTSNTPDSPWRSTVTSQDGLAEAIQLLSCRPLPNSVQMHQMQQLHSIDVSLVDEQGASVSSTRR